MAIEDIGLCTSQTTASSIGIQLYAGASAVSARLMWSTMLGTDTQASFTIKTRWRGIPKGGSGGEDEGYNAWSSWRETTVSSSACSPWQSSSSDRWYWWVALETALGSYAMGGSSWSYSGRAYDQIQIEAVINSNYLDEIDGSMASAAVSSEQLYVGAYPDLRITDAYLQSNSDATTSLVLLYADSAGDWTRTDDRYEVLSLAKGGTAVIDPNTWGHQSGKIDKFGWIELPTAGFKTLLATSETISLSVRWNASYRPAGMSWVAWSGSLELSDNGSVNAPTVSLSALDDGSISVTVGDSGSGGSSPISCATATVFGSSYEFDEASGIAVGEPASLPFPPLDVETTIQVQGSNLTGGTSEVVESSVVVPSYGRVLVDPIDSAGARAADQVVGRLDVGWSESFAREQTVVKFAGRPRPSAAFGEGGEASVSASFVVERAGGLPDAGAVASLLDAGLAVVRVPGGRRWLVALGGVSVSESFERGASEVTISGEEVV